MGGTSIGMFPDEKHNYREEFKAVAEACAKYDFSLEPTGGNHA